MHKSNLKQRKTKVKLQFAINIDILFAKNNLIR